MQQIEVQNFQNLTIKNDKIINTPLNQAKKEEENILTVVFIRDPYAYFDYLLFNYLKHQKSMLFTQDIISNMKKLDNENFLTWLETLNFIPFYNPQTFQLDISKRSLTTMENIESFDYVVPYEEIDIFLKNISLDITIHKGEETKLLFSLSTQRNHEIINKLIGKDLELYERSLELWELIKKNNFKPLGTLIEHKRVLENRKIQVEGQKMKMHKGIVGQITTNSIIGWVCHKDKMNNVVISIYRNGIFLRMIKADIMREDLKKKQIHPTGICGFEAIFNEPTFKKGDTVEIKILPNNTILPLGENVKKFLK